MKKVPQKRLTFWQKQGLNLLMMITVIIISVVVGLKIRRDGAKWIRDITTPKTSPTPASR